MKKTIFSFFFVGILFCLMIGVNSCQPNSKAACKGVECKNGGTCIDGSCSCPPNYSGVSCQTYTSSDPCADVTCYNGGACVNGACDCPPNYSGPYCQTYTPPSPPVGLQIDKIVLVKYPQYDTSNPAFSSVWDPNDGPDIFLRLNYGQSTSDPVLYTSYLKPNCVYGTQYTFQTGFPWNVYELSHKYTVFMWDDDGSSSKYMGGIWFIPSNYAAAHPATIPLSAGNIYYILYVTWLY